jgi:hypothetical protein
LSVACYNIVEEHTCATAGRYTSHTSHVIAYKRLRNLARLPITPCVPFLLQETNDLPARSRLAHLINWSRRKVRGTTSCLPSGGKRYSPFITTDNAKKPDLLIAIDLGTTFTGSSLQIRALEANLMRSLQASAGLVHNPTRLCKPPSRSCRIGQDVRPKTSKKCTHALFTRMAARCPLGGFGAKTMTDQTRLGMSSSRSFSIEPLSKRHIVRVSRMPRSRHTRSSLYSSSSSARSPPR